MIEFGQNHDEQPGRAVLAELRHWGKDEYVERLQGYPTPVRREVLRQAAAIWPVSYALCYNFFDRVDRALACLPLADLGEWVNATLDVYEKEGLRSADRFMEQVAANFLCRLRGEHGLSFAAAMPRLLPYLRGLAGRNLLLAAAPECWTDGETIFLPAEITLFKESRLNFLAYKLLATYQWGLLHWGTFRRPRPWLWPGSQVPAADSRPFPADFWGRFAEPRLAARLFGLAETLRLDGLLAQELPGLSRDGAVVRRKLWQLRPDLARLSGRARLVEALEQWGLDRQIKNAAGSRAAGEEVIYHRAVALLAAGGDPAIVDQAVANQATADRVAVDQAGAAQAATAPAALNQTPLNQTSFDQDAAGVEQSLALVQKLYALVTEIPGDYQAGGEPLALLGRLQPAAVAATRLRRREETKQKFVEALAALLLPEMVNRAQQENPESQKEDELPGEPGRAAAPLLANEQGLALLPPAGEQEDEADQESEAAEPPLEYLVIGGQELELPADLRELAQDIRHDLGRVPRRYLSAALDHAGSGLAGGPGSAVAEGEAIAAAAAPIYDEWDYRRAGFRKEWCRLLLKELAPVQGNFVAQTLSKYRGPLLKLKRQFEMMRLEQRPLKRQRDGDEIDLDACLEAIADAKAGVTPSENLFIRLQRDQRNIAAVFLVDMSSSTEGWVSTALKESLALMCEALAGLGDRYAIYGFSGMRRQRSELYHIKHLDEPYGPEVKGRIAAITPKEYTRMGPPIRHLTRLLAATEAKVRLLITLSDGKPEDYDDYKGEYAIEDTRHALIEAKAAAIHPFCITIDRHSHDYIPHMYGAVNYCFLDDVNKLPLRLPAIYRSLTT